jgi:hypothetical protein
MTSGILFVETAPSTPAELDSYHAWYADVHIPEMLGIDGVRAARRFATDGDTFIAIYDLDDVDQARAGLTDALKTGRMSRPAVTRSDPPPVMRFFTSLQQVDQEAGA